MGWLAVVVFLLAQEVMLFAFYRVVIRPLPAQINDLLFKRHLENDFTQVSAETAASIRDAFTKLEDERLVAIVEYEALKGKRLSVTESAQRKAFKEAASRLARQIDGLRGQLNELYAPEVLTHLRRFEELRLVAALNRFLDVRQSTHVARKRKRKS